MNVEQVYNDVLGELRRYFAARCTKRMKTDGQEWQGGLTIVSSEDKRLEEIARLAIEQVVRSMSSDTRSRVSVEARALRMGDVFSRYTITKEGVAIDMEVTVVKVSGTSTKPQIRYSTTSGEYGDVAMEGSWLLSVIRPTADDIKELVNE